MALVSVANREAYLENKREQILKAALEVFKEKGYANTSIMDIAKRANMGKGTLYLYFKNKEELLYCVFMECSLIPTLVESSFDLDAPLEQVLRNFAKDVLTDLRDFVSLLLMSIPDLLKLTKEHSDASFNGIYTQICHNLEQYLDAKKERNEISQSANSKMLAQAFISMINFPVIMQEMGNVFYDSVQMEEYIEETIALLVNRMLMDNY